MGVGLGIGVGVGLAVRNMGLRLNPLESFLYALGVCAPHQPIKNRCFPGYALGYALRAGQLIIGFHMRWGVCVPKLNQKWAPVCPESGRRLADCCCSCCRPRAAAHAAVHAPAQTPDNAPAYKLPVAQATTHATAPFRTPRKRVRQPRGGSRESERPCLTRKQRWCPQLRGRRPPPPIPSEMKGPGASQTWNVRSWVCAGYAPPTDARQGPPPPWLPLGARAF